MDLLPSYAVTGGLDLHALPPVTLADRSHMRQLQLEDGVTGGLLCQLEDGQENDSQNSHDLPHYAVIDGLRPQN